MGHWYKQDGSKAYEVEAANGKMRPTTLRDARKSGLVPSVTTILGIQDKPQLLQWLKNELLEACLNNRPPICEDAIDEHYFPESVKQWKREVVEQSNIKTQRAQEWGTKIHDELEYMISEGGWRDRNLAKVCHPVIKFLHEKFPDAKWVTEKTFTNMNYGFGGAIDLHCPVTNIVLDFKTKMKPAEDIAKLKAYDDHHIQTAAYAIGLQPHDVDARDWKRYNLFVGYDVKPDGKLEYTGLKLTESTNFEREWGMFLKLLEFWQMKNNYVPREVI